MCLPASRQDTFSNYWAILLSPLFNLNPLFSQYKCKLVHRQRTVTWSRSCCEDDDAATAKWRTLPAKTTVENDDGNMNEHRIFSGTQYLATTLVESLWESTPPLPPHTVRNVHHLKRMAFVISSLFYDRHHWENPVYEAQHGKFYETKPWHPIGIAKRLVSAYTYLYGLYVVHGNCSSKTNKWARRFWVPGYHTPFSEDNF